MENLTVNENEVLKYLTTTGKAYNKSHIGVAVGKRQPKNAASWSTPILESLCEKGLVKIDEQNGRIFYIAATSSSPVEKQTEIKNDVIGAIDEKKLRKKFPANVEGSKEMLKSSDIEVEHRETPDEVFEIEASEQIVNKKDGAEKTIDISDLQGEYTLDEVKTVTKEISKRIKAASTEFNFKKAKREILKLSIQLIADKEEYDSPASCISKALREWTDVNGDIPEDYFQRVMRPIKRKLDPSVKPVKGLPRTNILDRVDKESMKQWTLDTWNAILENKEIADNVKKRELIKLVKNKISVNLSEASMRANMVKSYISTLIRETTTGKQREFRNDGREFEKGMRVKFQNKKGEIKEGVIMRIFLDKVFFQRTIIVKADDSDKTEMKIDRKIIEVIS